MNWMDYATYKLLDTIHANQLVMIGMLKQLLKQEAAMAVDLTSLTSEVTNNTNETQSVIQLLQNLTTIINNIPPSNDPATQAALDQLTSVLKDNDTAIANAVVANTPAAPQAAPTVGQSGPAQ